MSTNEVRNEPPFVMPSRFVFVVMASVDHECSDAIRAFTSRPDAESFATVCEAYQRQEPRLPDVDAPDEEWQAADEAVAEWRREHPAGDDGVGADRYHVVEIPFGLPEAQK